MEALCKSNNGSLHLKMEQNLISIAEHSELSWNLLSVTVLLIFDAFMLQTILIPYLKIIVSTINQSRQ